MAIRCLVRHPRVEVTPGVCYGQSDVGLATGWEVFASQLADYMQKTGIRMLVASPLARCRLPAQWAAAQTHCELRLDERLKEISFGDWELCAWDSIPRAALDAWAADLSGFSPPQGESGQELIARVTAFWNEASTGEACAILSHGGPLRILEALVARKEIDLSVTAIPLGKIAPVS
ncbi:histidine phosphatase family protein [Acetobacter sp.]|jgi:alpha-ribazole phosphatase|uniref:histidine phosphatase family protein n=1 Tax=Acetobacter sp. TaxID=440 RepID=UPI0025BE5332|nr:histidine phosphatase family protein [Acetobacter sp.]MCH4089724.1 histidine phosphatase family protein [Acetobacter sp.]MCI1298420.1 histidine phosphatase family protein [Acetobacter sp.]MCI1316375.1 histidine phosphatase family protein [Acetobacter sp.]